MCPFCRAGILDSDGETRLDYVNEYSRFDVKDGDSKLDKKRIENKTNNKKQCAQRKAKKCNADASHQ